MIAAYCWPQSAKPSESVELFCHTNAQQFQLEVIRIGAEDKSVFRQSAIAGREQGLSGAIAEEGCQWEVSFQLTIADDWPSGFYLVRLEDSAGCCADAFFVVHSAKPADALLVLSTSTWNAYNTWGGQSYYTGGQVVSPKRPLPPGFLQKADPHQHRQARFIDWQQDDARAFAAAGYDKWSMAAGWANWEVLFVRWAERQGYQLGYAVSQDLDRDPAILGGYPLYLSVGHDEYWSAGMRDAVEGYVDAGGNAAFFSGNTSFWQVRFANDYRQMISYKCEIEDDPVYDPTLTPGEAPALATMWSDPLVGRPESQMTGVTFTRGGYAHMPHSPRGSGGYQVWQPDHWAFHSTALRLGDTLGAKAVVVGYECDGCELAEQNGRLVRAPGGHNPANFEVLATAPARLWETSEVPDDLADNFVGEQNWLAERLGGEDTAQMRAQYADGHAVLGTFSRGKGQVFTSGCTDWAYGLVDEQVAQVTRNVLRRFIG